MKNVIFPLVFLALSTSVVAQGFINYSIRVTGSLIAHVYGPEASDPGVAKFGNTASEFPEGTQSYTGPFLTGSGWSAQLFAANGPGQPESSLTAVSTSITSFRTGSTFAGTIAPSGQTIPWIPEGGAGTFQLRVWDNLGGTVSSWLQAESLWASGALAAGKSALFDIPNLASQIVPATDMLNFRSFNVYFIPEPEAFALAGLGAAALLLFRRRSIFHHRGPL